MFAAYILFIPERIFWLIKAERTRRRWVQFTSWICSTALLRGGWAGINVYQKEKFPKQRKDLCIVSNHQAYADILVLQETLPCPAGYIAKESLSRIPIVNTWMRALNCFFLKRNNMRSGIEAIRYGAKMIRSGFAMIIFPEGTRSRKSEMNEFKKGSLKLASESKGLLVPVTIEGTYKLLEQYGKIRRCNVSVMYHDPIDCANLTKEEERELPMRVENIIREGQKKLLAVKKLG